MSRPRIKKPRRYIRVPLDDCAALFSPEQLRRVREWKRDAGPDGSHNGNNNQPANTVEVWK